MKREDEIEECRTLIENESPDHLHIRKRAVVASFTDDLREELQGDYRVISIDIAEWNYDEVMETLRWELQKELSMISYHLSRLKSIGITIKGFGARGGREKGPDYSRVKKYLKRVSDQSDKHLVLFVDHHGKKPVDDFRWVSKLNEIPENTVLVTHGYQKCKRSESEEVEVGPLSKEQTVNYLAEVREDISETEAVEIHHLHDGNPIAIQIALERGDLKEALSGDELNKLWTEVYDDKLSANELDLLYESGHLVDLDSRDVAMTASKTRGECRQILRSLESKGVVSEKKSGLFTTDRYVNRYIMKQLEAHELSENHRESFQTYTRRWVESYVAHIQEMRSEEEDKISPKSMFSESPDQNLLNENFFFAIHHLANIHEDMDRKTFVQELLEVDAKKSGVFVFGISAQRFFFEDPKKISQDLAESLLSFDDKMKNELFSGTFDILLNFDLGECLEEFSKGWSGDVSTEELIPTNVSQPDQAVELVQQRLVSENELYGSLPQDVRLALIHFLMVPLVHSRTARDYYARFGKTAEKYDLEEDPFCEWLDELGSLFDTLNPEIDPLDDRENNPLKSNLLSLDDEIRDRTELTQRLENNRTEAQQEFQQKMDSIRSKPNEVAEQYVTCGEKLSRTSNSLFPFIWYAFGDRFFSDIVLGSRNWKIFGEYNRWLGKREEYELNCDPDDLIVTAEEIEAVLE